jgi:hypothetical protein
MQFITRLNVFRRKAFGIVGAPAVTGAATAAIVGWGIPAVATYIKGVPVTASMKVAIGAAVCVVLVTEAGFRFLGKDAKVLYEENSRQLGQFGAAMLADPGLLKMHAGVHGKTERQARLFAESLVAAANKPVVAEAEAEVESDAKATG